MAQKSVHRRVTQARHIAQGAVALASFVASRLEAKHQPHRERLPASPDFLAMQHHCADWLSRSADRLQAADRAYEAQKSTRHRLRVERDETARAFYRRLVQVRTFLTEHLPGTAARQLLGLKGRTPREPWPLLDAGEVLVGRLRNERFEMPASKSPGVTFDRQVLADTLGRQVAALEEAIKAVDRATAREGLLQVLRDDALAEFREVRTGVARILEGLYVAAGLRHLVPGIRNPRAAATHRSGARPQHASTAAHQPTARLEPESAASHHPDAGVMHETTAPHRPGVALEHGPTPTHRPGAASELEPTTPHRPGTASATPTPPARRSQRRSRLRWTAPSRSSGGSSESLPGSRGSAGGPKLARRALGRSGRRQWELGSRTGRPPRHR
jgi:hypothetical protein